MLGTVQAHCGRQIFPWINEIKTQTQQRTKISSYTPSPWIQNFHAIPPSESCNNTEVLFSPLKHGSLPLIEYPLYTVIWGILSNLGLNQENLTWGGKLVRFPCCLALGGMSLQTRLGEVLQRPVFLPWGTKPTHRTVRPAYNGHWTLSLTVPQLPPLPAFLQLYHSLEYTNHSLDEQKTLALQAQVGQGIKAAPSNEAAGTR